MGSRRSGAVILAALVVLGACWCIPSSAPTGLAASRSTVVFDMTAHVAGGHASVQVLELDNGIFGPLVVLRDRPVPSRQVLTFHRDRGLGSLAAAVRVMGEPVVLDDCVISVDGRVVVHDRGTLRCTYSENPEWGYLVEKGIP